MLPTVVTQGAEQRGAALNIRNAENFVDEMFCSRPFARTALNLNVHWCFICVANGTSAQ